MEYEAQFRKIPETVRGIATRVQNMVAGVVYTLKSSENEGTCFPDFEEQMTDRIDQYFGNREDNRYTGRIIDREDSDMVG